LPEQQVFPYLWDGNYACRKNNCSHDANWNHGDSKSLV
jgi:hypothetical protein